MTAIIAAAALTGPYPGRADSTHCLGPLVTSFTVEYRRRRI
jgi:hypothetical protein